MRDRQQQTKTFARANFAAAGRLVLCCLGFSVLSFFERPAAAASGTLLVLQNPSNSSPRLASIWGGGGSGQITMKSAGSVWDWGLDSEGELGNGTTNLFTNTVPFKVLGPG